MATRRQRAIVKWLWEKSKSPRLTAAANDGGQAVVVLTGLVWASILAAHFSAQSDDVIAPTFSKALDVSTTCFCLAVATQLFFIFSKRSVYIKVMACSIYIATALCSYLTMSGTMALLSGANSVRYSDFAVLSEEFQECMRDKIDNINNAVQHRDRLELHYEICQASVDSDLFHLRIATTEKRIPSNYADEAKLRTMKRCASIIKDLEQSEQRIKAESNKDCKMPKPTPPISQTQS